MSLFVPLTPLKTVITDKTPITQLAIRPAIFHRGRLRKASRAHCREKFFLSSIAR